jgi:leader peptidase (prepilin peptidase)/N-methyltransferase
MTWPVVAALVSALAAGWSSARLAERLAGRRPPAWMLILADLAVAALALRFSAGWALSASLGLGFALVLLCATDILILRLPDLITYPLGLAGLVAGPRLLHAPLLDHALGAAIGFTAFAAVGWAYVRLRGREGLGLGDAKLCGVAGAWLGWVALPSLVVLACGAGLAWVGVRLLREGRQALAGALPFGAPLSLALWTLWLLAQR